jgi:hypothetical protein
MNHDWFWTGHVVTAGADKAKMYACSRCKAVRYETDPPGPTVRVCRQDPMTGEFTWHYCDEMVVLGVMES